ncbi:MAG TPA: amylo-alpha-1,6-glucosidase [Longimicrobiales bacterium]|nr:amylo-alpha-1,6-glucosidase [Longimicrobiales bacterium]
MSEAPHGVTQTLDRAELLRKMPWEPASGPDWAPLVEREWLVANGLGGYASGTVSCAATRRYHGLLVAALPAPLGRVLLLLDLAETVRLPGGREVHLGGDERPDALELHGSEHLREFRLDHGLPAWRYQIGETVLEKHLVLVHGQNTVSVRYRIVSGPGVELSVRPMVDIRSHDAMVGDQLGRDYDVRPVTDGLDVGCRGGPDLHIRFAGAGARFDDDPAVLSQILYRVEARRGYASVGDAWSPGRIEARLEQGASLDILATAEETGRIDPAGHDAREVAELTRRRDLLDLAGLVDEAIAAELTLAADAFIVSPATRAREESRARAAGGETKSIIAGYHWFTDWGRDTMISLEGLALVTGRHREAAAILRTFADHIRDGLIPNMFPEGDEQGLYHTADATLWFFHAVHRYVRATGDRELLRELLPRLREIVDAHLRGTRFGIGVDPTDGLLRQGAEGYQLTWMDAKVDEWVVTPRRGKAVEINALWYNALRLLEEWLGEEGGESAAAQVGGHADRVRSSFNARFWYDEGGYLYDVVDGEAGDDAAFRPNQVFAISLDRPVLDEERWPGVMEKVEARLLTPVGLRSLAPGHTDYQPRYFGDLRARDAAYHQGTVWGWLIGPFVDAWLRVHPGDRARAASFLEGLLTHLDEACIGSMSEVFDAEPPHTPRGCVAQAWTVAEVLRCHVGITRPERVAVAADAAAADGAPGPAAVSATSEHQS